MNTKICYLYRDAHNYKVHNECVINGLLNDEQKAQILDCLHDVEYFIPNRVGLPEKRFDRWDDEVDHIWFELDEEGFEETQVPANVPITPDELVQAFERNRHCWDKDVQAPVAVNSIEMHKTVIAKEIGDYFGRYFEADGYYCIDNGDEMFQYKSLNELLTDWVDTLVENHHDNTSNPPFSNINDSWEKQIVFIYSEVVGKLPPGVRVVPHKGEEARWQVSVDVYIPGQTGAHGKNLYLGTHSSIVDAIFARREFEELRNAGQINNIDELVSLAKDICSQAKIKDLAGEVKISLNKEEIKKLQEATGCRINSDEDLRAAVLTAIRRHIESYPSEKKSSLDDKIQIASVKADKIHKTTGHSSIKRDLIH